MSNITYECLILKTPCRYEFYSIGKQSQYSQSGIAWSQSYPHLKLSNLAYHSNNLILAVVAVKLVCARDSPFAPTASATNLAEEDSATDDFQVKAVSNESLST